MDRNIINISNANYGEYEKKLAILNKEGFKNFHRIILGKSGVGMSWEQFNMRFLLNCQKEIKHVKRK